MLKENIWEGDHDRDGEWVKKVMQKETWDDTDDKLWEDLRRQSLGRAHTIAETMEPDEARHNKTAKVLQ